jgi:putative membrane protein
VAAALVGSVAEAAEDGPAEAAVLAEEVPVEAGNQKWAQRLIKEGDSSKVSAAVAKAEKQTSGEIVPIIVRRSSTIGHVPFLLTLILLVALLVFEVPQLPVFARYNLNWILFFVALFCFLISIPLSKSIWVQRMLVSQTDQKFQVEERALLEFYQTGIVNTKARTGILLFLSVMERKAVVLADEAIAQKLPPETWTEICQVMVQGVKKGETAEGLTQAIEICGQVLAKHFPAQELNPNELKDHLIIKI